MNITELLEWQWAGYPRYHRSRNGLLLHMVLVPVFLVANVLLVTALLQGGWITALIAGTLMVASLALQGRAHCFEAVPPEPFAGPADVALRIILEQWVTFPRFALSGGWLSAWRGASAA